MGVVSCYRSAARRRVLAERLLPWAPAQNVHGLFPRSFRLAARALLLVNYRAAWAGGAGGSLPPELVEAIVRAAAHPWEPWLAPGVAAELA